MSLDYHAKGPFVPSSLRARCPMPYAARGRVLVVTKLQRESAIRRITHQSQRSTPDALRSQEQRINHQELPKRPEQIWSLRSLRSTPYAARGRVLVVTKLQRESAIRRITHQSQRSTPDALRSQEQRINHQELPKRPEQIWSLRSLRSTPDAARGRVLVVTKLQMKSAIRRITHQSQRPTAR